MTSLGAGQPLHPAERSYFEPRFGFSLDTIRIHAGPEAARSAAAIHASAFTVAKDVVFGAGQYRPSAPASRRLLAHELAHVAQARRPGTPAAAARQVIRRQTETPIEATGLVVGDNAKLYDSPGSSKKVLQTLAKRSVVEVTAEVGSDLYKVVVNKTTGYAHQNDVWLPAGDKPLPVPEYVQKIIDKSLKKLIADSGERFWHLDATFGFKLARWGKDTSKRLPPGTGDKEGWLKKDFGKLFKRVGAKAGGPKVYALVSHDFDYFLANTAVHKHTVLPGGKVKEGHFPFALEIGWIRPDWEKRVAANEKKK